MISRDVKQRLLALSFWLLTPSWAQAENGSPGIPAASAVPAGLLTIRGVDGEAGDSLSLINIRLDKKPAWQKPKLEAHDSFLQLKLTDTIIPDPGVFYDIQSPFFKKVVIFQSQPTEALVRIITSGAADAVHEASDVDILHDRLVISANHAMLQKLLAPAPGPVSGAAVAAREQSPALEGQATSAAALSKVAGEAKENPQAAAALSWSLPPAAESNLQAQLVTMAYFSLAMIGLLLLVLTLKRFMKNQRLRQVGANTVSMYTLSHLILAPKQKLSLVQVGQERLLLSVGPEGISLITQFPKEEKAQRPQRPAPMAGAWEGQNPEPRRQRSTPAAAMVGVAASSPPVVKAKTVAQVEPSLNDRGEAQVAGKLAPKPRLQYAIGDQGIQREGEASIKPGRVSTEKAIEDVTQMIREKLKSLPKI